MYAAVSDISYIAESIGSKTVGLQYPVWLLHNIDSNIEYIASYQRLILFAVGFALPWTDSMQAPRVHAR